MLEFLGLPEFEGAVFEQHNARPRAPMDAGAGAHGSTSTSVPYDERLEAWLGHRPGWRVVTEDGSTVPAERVDRLARDGLMALVGAGVTAVLNLVLVFVTIHAAGRATAGVVFAATSAFLIAETAARLGCPTGLMYFLVRARTLGNVGQLRGMLRAGLLPVVVVSTPLSVVVLVVSEPLGTWMAPGHACPRRCCPSGCSRC